MLEKKELSKNNSVVKTKRQKYKKKVVSENKTEPKKERKKKKEKTSEGQGEWVGKAECCHGNRE